MYTRAPGDYVHTGSCRLSRLLVTFVADYDSYLCEKLMGSY